MTSSRADSEARGTALLSVSNLTVAARTTRGERRLLLAELSFDVAPGEVVALVGESGSGKSTACLAIARLLGPGVAVEEGSVSFRGRNLLDLPESEMRAVRGSEIGMVFQDPLASLNPVRKIGFQVAEPRRIHRLGTRQQVRGWVRETLQSLGFAHPDQAAAAYPPTFSGGMRQRACVGIAFAAEPRLVIADEPTTSLDISLQGRLLRLLLDYREQYGTSMILVSHDVDVVRAVADRVVVLYGGRALESGRTEEVLRHPKSPYTSALLAAVPHMDPDKRGQPLPTIEGTAEGAANTVGCPFRARCPRALEVCGQRFPDATSSGDGHVTWCWNPNPDSVERGAVTAAGSDRT